MRLAADDAGRFLSGLRRRIDGADAAAVRVYGSEPRAFLGTAHITAGELIADRLLSPLEVRATIATDPTTPTLTPFAAPRGGSVPFERPGGH